MVIDPTPERRTVLKAIGAAGIFGSVGAASARSRQQDVSELRLFSEQAADNAMEVVTQQNHAYVATGDGMAVVDWRNPGRPETVAEIDLNDPLMDPSLSVLDVKVDGDLAALANDTEDPGGVALYDVSDPANPEFQAFYEPEPPANIHNCYVEGDHVYLGLSEPTNIDTDGDGERDLVRIFGDAGVEIVDASDPANPEHAATWLLKEEFPMLAKSGVVPNHDLYAQDGLLYNAFWDAGVVVLDVSDPSNPEFVAQFAEDSDITEIRPWRVNEESFGEYLNEVFPLVRYLGPPGNAHYVQPSPDGDYLFVGDETFVGGPSGIRAFDVSDFDAVEKVAEIDPPEGSGLRTAHNFDVTNNRLHSSWYNGGVRVHDITDPSDPEELFSYNPEDYSFWTAVRGRGFTLGGVYGARSTASAGGVAFLHTDRGAKRPPAFEGSAPPSDPEVEPEADEEK